MRVAPRDGRVSARKSLGALFCALVLLTSTCKSKPDAPTRGVGPWGVVSRIFPTGTDRQFDSGFRGREFLDRSRGIPSTDSGPRESFRRLKTTFYYPVRKGIEGTASDDLIPYEEGPFPLVVFCHGLGADAKSYRGLSLSIAAAGYVVMAPEFPLSSLGGDAGMSDARNQPRDVSFLIDQVEVLSKQEDRFARSIDTANVAAAGHSLGTGTVLGVGFNTCCRDQRVVAGLSLGTAEPSLTGLSGAPFPDAVPFLLVQGEMDSLEIALALYESAKAPKFLLTLEEADHFRPFIYPTPPAEPVQRLAADASVLFLNASVKGDREGYSRIARVVENNNLLGRLQSEV